MSLLERYQAGSQLDSHGQFTLDESQARRKMARFQLRNGFEFLFLMVGAALAGGCRSLELRAEGTSVELLAPGALFDEESLDQLEDFLFDSEPENAAYRLLAVAVNAVETESAAPPALSMQGDSLRIRVLLNAALPDLSETLRRRLSYFPRPLIIDGQPVETRPLTDRFRVELAPGYVSRIELVRHGVLLDTPISGSHPIEFQAVAAADHLTLDASFAQVVEDKAYDQLISDLRRQANELLAERARAYRAGGETTGELLAHFRRKHPDPAGSALDGCPFFPFADRPGQISLSEIRDIVKQQGRMLYSARRYDMQLSSPVLHLQDGALRTTLLERLPARALEDADVEYTALVAARRARERWEKTPRPTELPPGNYMVEGRAEDARWEAALGFLSSPGGPGRMDVLYQGKLLGSEPLTDVPPGAAVVVNLREGKVDPGWERLEAKELRDLLKALRGRLEQLFEAHTVRPKDLYPALADYLLGRLVTKSAPHIATSAPLFPTIDGGEVYSLDQLQALGQVAMGEARPLPDRVPKDCLPSPLLLYSGERRRALVQHLGPSKVQDARPLQERLLQICQKMADPLPARLPRHLQPLFSEAVRVGQSHGEIGLLDARGGKLRCMLMKDGVVFDQPVGEGGRILEVAAVVEASGLTLRPDWSGFQRDAAYSELMEALKQQAVGLEKRLLEQEEPELDLFRELLRFYPQDSSSYRQRALIPTTTPARKVSLARLKDELATHGHILRGQSGMEIEGREVVLTPDRELLAFLSQQLGSLRWKEASVLLTQRQAAEQFGKRRALSRVRLDGRCLLKADLPGTLGEIGLLAGSPGGEVHCYVGGRYVCKKAGLLPSPFVAALNSEEMKLSDLFDDVEVPDSLREVLKQAAGELMLQAVDGRPEAQDAAWSYFTRSKDAGWRKRFEEAVAFELLGGGEIRLSEVAAGRARGYVGSGFSGEAPAKDRIVRLEGKAVERLGRYLDRRLRPLEEELKAEAERARVLRTLPTSLPAGIFQRHFEHGELSAEIGVWSTPVAVGLDGEGSPLGYLKEPLLPVFAIVRGARAEGARARNMKPELPGRGYAMLNDWAESLCLRWVREKGVDPALALGLLSLTVREVGSSKSRPTAEMAGLLWDMPLFRRVDGTRVSGSALAQQLAESESPLLMSSSRLRVPGEVLLVEEGSVEHRILQAALGRASLALYEAPPLVDLDLGEVSRSIGRAVSWGLAPLGKGATYLGRRLKQAYKAHLEGAAEDPRALLVAHLRTDAAVLLGGGPFQRADGFFEHLDFGRWPLGPPLYRVNRSTQKTDPKTLDLVFGFVSHFRLNLLHPAVRWLLSGEGDEASRRAARMMLLVNWIGQANVASQELTDDHEREFLLRLTERMVKTFASGDDENRSR